VGLAADQAKLAAVSSHLRAGQLLCIKDGRLPLLSQQPFNDWASHTLARRLSHTLPFPFHLYMGPCALFSPTPSLRSCDFLPTLPPFRRPC
jgi:hypothetical protein